MNKKSWDEVKLSGIPANDGTYVEFTRDALNRDDLVRKWYIDAPRSYPALHYQPRSRGRAWD
ncbi:MAG TPA: hypothetical protein VHO24_12070 [Opitutaceae bacterium]|nr:hypothetical protein [Opitutaceae bacterium]